MFNFEKLDVWQKSIDFVERIYNVTEQIPESEKFAIISQITRAAISISSNIAEGSGRKYKKEFGRFISMSYGSVCEVITLLKICLIRKYIPKQTYDELYKDCEDLARMLSGLMDFTKHLPIVNPAKAGSGEAHPETFSLR